MRSTLDKLEGLGRKLSIFVPSEKVNDAFDRVYKGIQKNVEIKGFRKGKAPLATVKTMYSEKVKEDVLQDLISEHYFTALKEHSLDPVSHPKISFEEFSQDKDFNFSAIFEVRPEIKLEKIEGLKVEREKIEIKEEHIDKILEDLRTKNADLVPIFEDRPAQSGDVAEIDFEGVMLGSPLPGGSAQGHALELGSNSFIPGFEEGIIGMTIGSTHTLNLSFPESYHAKDIAGKPVSFKVTLKGLKKKSLPDLNDEFAKKIGEHKDLAELRDVIKKEILAGETERIQEELRMRVLKVLATENPIEVPEALKEQQKAQIVEDAKNRLAQQGMRPEEFEEYKKKWDADFEESARFMIQTTFLVDALADKFQMRATDSEIDSEIEYRAQSMGFEPQRLRDFYNTNQERRGQLRFQVTERKVVDFLLSKAEIKEVTREKLA